jgi:phosphatidylglycerophosphate synthase
MKNPSNTRLLLRQSFYSVPNHITLIRPLGTILFAVLILQPPPHGAFWLQWGPGLVFLGVVSSDILDGWLARRLRQTSHVGRILDHTCDVLFILSALSTFVVRGLAPWWLPASIAWAFLLYVMNLWWWPPVQPWRRFLGGRLGHLGGILYYVTTGIVTLQVCTEAWWFSPTVLWGWFLGTAGVAVVSGSEHLMQLWRRALHACHARPRAESPPQSSH